MRSILQFSFLIVASASFLSQSAKVAEPPFTVTITSAQAAVRIGSPIVLAIILSMAAHKSAFAQTAPELQQLVTQLHDPTTTDEASIQIKALAGSNAAARRSLTKELPEVISKTSEDHSQFKVWLNSVRLAGELKIEESIPVLVTLFDPARYSPSAVSTRTSRTTFANDPVAKALVQLGEPAIGPVSSILEDKNKDQYTRLRAALVLYNMKSPDADTALVQDLQTETDPRVRSFIEARLKGRQATVNPQ
jgi:HEAT repeat protein